MHNQLYKQSQHVHIQRKMGEFSSEKKKNDSAINASVVCLKSQLFTKVFFNRLHNAIIRTVQLYVYNDINC